MIEMQPLTESALAREALKRLSDAKSSLHRCAHVLELVGKSSVGLGEVIQDFARQGHGQLCEIIRAAADAARNEPGHPEDVETLRNIHYTLKSVGSVLEMIPAAMQRNKSDALGEKERLSRADIAEITHAFLHSPDIARLLAAEDSGEALAALVIGADGAMASNALREARLAATH